MIVFEYNKVMNLIILYLLIFFLNHPYDWKASAKISWFYHSSYQRAWRYQARLVIISNL